MGATSRGIVVFPPDVPGMLAAAGLLRRLGPDHDLLALGPHEVARRLYGLSAEAELRPVYVVDLLPTDSVDTLLVPALDRFAEAGIPVTWVLGGGEPGELLDSLESRVVLWRDHGDSWRLVAAAHGDAAFAELAGAIIAGTHEPGATWRTVLEAASSSWDWPRVYDAVTQLALLRVPSAEDQAWATEQMTDVRRTLAALGYAAVSEVAGLRVAVLDDSALSARVRPEVVQGRRTDVEAVGFVAGPGRLRLVATDPRTDLCVLQTIPGLTEGLEEGTISGSITTPRAELSWPPGITAPAPIAALVDPNLFEQAPVVDDDVRIVRPPSERRAKGTDPDRLPPQDRELIGEVLGSPVPPAGRETGGAAPADLHPPAHRTDVEIQPVAPSS